MATQVLTNDNPHRVKSYMHEVDLLVKLTKKKPVTVFKVYLDRTREAFAYFMKVSGKNYLHIEKGRPYTLHNSGFLAKAAKQDGVVCCYGIEEVDTEIRINTHGKNL